MPMLKRSAVSTLKNVGKKVAENVLRSGTNSVINAITKTNTKRKKTSKTKLQPLSRVNKNHLKRKLTEAVATKSFVGKGVIDKRKKRRVCKKKKCIDIFDDFQ